ncbi:hypothetical protein [Streptomyces chrestomyceticus]|uniref:hypothetical protein n=1 Tax=Streptomyces chrestomyceticus TaxID=68185 RepID=UPI003401792D
MPSRTSVRHRAHLVFCHTPRTPRTPAPTRTTPAPSPPPPVRHSPLPAPRRYPPLSGFEGAGGADDGVGAGELGCGSGLALGVGFTVGVVRGGWAVDEGRPLPGRGGPGAAGPVPGGPGCSGPGAAPEAGSGSGSGRVSCAEGV